MKLLRYSTLLCILALVLVSMSFAANSLDRQQVMASQVKNAQTAQELEQAGYATMAMEERFNNVVNSSIQSGISRQQTLRDVQRISTPENLVPLFVEQLYKNNPDMDRLLERANQNQVLAGTGSIAGTVTVDGAGHDTDNEILVIAFDAHGYFSGIATVSETGSYSVNGLPDGDYYVMTWSHYYVDELYPNVFTPLSDLQSWRDADKVTVAGGGATTGINFDLAEPAMLSGTLYMASDNSLVRTYSTLTFTVTRANSPLPIITYETYANNGTFEDVPVPTTGNFKVHVEPEIDTLGGAWYGGGQTWAEAATISVNSFGQQVSDIDFMLPTKSGTVEEPTGNVSGTITLDNGLTPPFNWPFLGVVVAYDADDMSLAGFSIALLGSYGSDFLPLELPEGEYYIFADDYLEDLQTDEPGIDYTNYLGAFYSDAGGVGALTIEEATPVQVVVDDMVSDINIKLPTGGELGGTVTFENGSPVDSLLMLAVNSEFLNDPQILPSLGLGITMTDLNGDYKFTGLPNGEYLVATFSQYVISLDTLDLNELLKEGKHKGKLVDELYNDVQSLADLDQMEFVVIENHASVTGIDIQLETGTHVSGTITDAENSSPVKAAAIAAIDIESGFPVAVIGQFGNIIDFNGYKHDGLDILNPGDIDDDGNWNMGPLPSGNYTFLIVPGPFEGKAYLPEFYDGSRDFNTANAIALTGAAETDINFTLDKSAVIQGFVDLGEDSMYPAGADTLFKAPVLVYDATNGEPVSWGFVQFNGGFRVDNLYPGTYKAAVLPIHSGYPVTYMGGGASYGDPATDTIDLTFGQVYNENVELKMATGAIMGSIKDQDGMSPLSYISVVAYDADGHVAGYGISDYNMITDASATSDGSYSITGLRDGNYYLRSYSLSSFLPLISGASGLIDGLLGIGTGADDLLGGLLGGDTDIDLGGLDISFSIYGDIWYNNVSTGMDVNLDDILMQILSADLANRYESNLMPLYFPAPLYQSVPAGAQAVAVSGGAVVSNVDLVLQETDIFTYFTDVEEENIAAPARFELQQNYPNPFNPTTTLAYSLAKTSEVSVDIYDTLGRKVTSLVSAHQPAGQYRVVWNGRDHGGQSVAAGLYFATIKAGNFQQTVKMLLVK